MADVLHNTSTYVFIVRFISHTLTAYVVQVFQELHRYKLCYYLSTLTEFQFDLIHL